MSDPSLLQRIEDALEELNQLKGCLPLPTDDWELALELGEDEAGEPICSYYFACHPTRCLFWLHEFNPESALGGLRGVTELTHIHLALQVQYWNHWEMYPHDREVPESFLQELSGILVYGGIDCLSSPNSTIPLAEGDLRKFLGYVKHIPFIGGNHGYSACTVGRLMGLFAYSRFLNFHGQKGARLTSDQTIYGLWTKRTYLIKVSSILLFYIPQLHLEGLHSIRTDSVLSQHRWAEFIVRLQAGWTGFTLYGAVLLVVNVAFLAIPSVDPGNRARTSAQFASYISTIASLGSIVAGLLLLRWHGGNPQDSSEQVDCYLRSHRGSELGFEILAILYSLPDSLLLWSIVAFTTAFGIETLAFSRQLWTKLSVGILLAMMTILISCLIWTLAKGRAYFSVLGRVHSWKDGLVSLIRGLKFTSPPRSGARGNGQRNSTRLNVNTCFGLLPRRRARMTTDATLVPDVSNKGPESTV